MHWHLEPAGGQLTSGFSQRQILQIKAGGLLARFRQPDLSSSSTGLVWSAGSDTQALVFEEQHRH